MLYNSYIVSVKYKILLNDQPKGYIVSIRSLRQEDLLSSYFCLSYIQRYRDIRKEESEKWLTGVEQSLIHYLRMIGFFNVKL